ncbi:hypothetical protein LWI28_018947 [Acer negundo]|uniref:Uncharacterized protein n=1 Tax=Acer negundo TaxID=4023 RepID=A0AAD5JJD3_ACENE|nr:hypothetical protein LWI28_018947 [Acer negundo]
MHGDCGRNLTNETGYVMDPMFIEASLFVASDPLEIPRSGPSNQVGSIEASSGSHMHGPSFAKEEIAKLCGSLSFKEKEGPVRTLDVTLKDHGDQKTALCLVGKSSVEDISNLLQGISQPSDDSTHHDVEANRKMRISKLIQDHNDLLRQLDDEKERRKIMKEIIKGKTSQGWWDSPIDDLNVELLHQLDEDFKKLSKTMHIKLIQK